jgi:uracil-DNA glycosylase family 4
MMKDFDVLDTEIKSCERCTEILAKHPENPPAVITGVLPRPILSDPSYAPIMLVGQAPGLNEYRTGRPFSGDAGHGIRALMARCGLKEDEFETNVYQTSIVKCYPGRKLNREHWEDRSPCSRMTANCQPFLLRQIELLHPRLIVTLGAFAGRQLDRLRENQPRRLADLVGLVEDWRGIRIIYLPHTSGSSRFLNDPENRRKYNCAQDKLTEEIRNTLHLHGEQRH